MKKHVHKSVDINVQEAHFSNLLALNKPIQFGMPLKLINQ